MTAAELQKELGLVRSRLLAAIAGVSEEQFKRRPPGAAAGEPSWCIAEVLAHLLATERQSAERITLALGEDGAAIQPGDPQEQQEKAR